MRFQILISLALSASAVMAAAIPKADPQTSYASYGDYAGAGVGNPPPPSPNYASYGDYPTPPGGYASYGAYKRDASPEAAQ
jgi:hypothetical protein